MPRDPVDLWNQLVDEAGEAEIDAAASMSVEQAERELAAAGFDVKAEREKAEAFLDELEGKAPAPTRTPAPTPAPPPARAIPPRRRGPPVLWLAAAAITVSGGAVLNAELRAPEPSLPSPPSPSAPPSAPPAPTEPPVDPNAPLVAAAAAAQLRTQAKAALDAGKPLDCLRLLDEASRTDPTGDAAPDIQALRARATKAIPPLKPGNH